MRDEASPIWDFRRNVAGKVVAFCKVCEDGMEQNATPSHCGRHEESQSHELALQHQQGQMQNQTLEPGVTDPDVNMPITDHDIVVDGLRHLLASLGGKSFPYPISNWQSNVQDNDNGSTSTLGIDWGLIELSGDTEFTPLADERAVASIANTILGRFELDLDALSDDEELERSDGGSDVKGGDEPQGRYGIIPHNQVNLLPNVLAVIANISLEQNGVHGILGKIEYVDYCPGTRIMLPVFKSSSPYQEMANPKVRPNLSFYPEDSGKKISEARQAARWLHEMPDDQLTPMHRIKNHDYYIYEPAMATSSIDGSVQHVVPVRWFSREGSIHAKCWRMIPVVTDQISGWRVIKTRTVEVSEAQFFKTFVEFQSDAALYNVPHPSLIIDVVNQSSAAGQTSPWKYTNPVLGNPWRAKAAGARVVSFPMWLYCDDTSGNISKKWNKHNSFLMTPAGLNQHESQKEYNIHFLATSNLAPPLEMMDGIVQQIETGQENGIWCWDIIYNEPVLAISEVLALLGDNPMQSKFACHIGLRGKFFCHACWAKGHSSEPESDTIPSSTQVIAENLNVGNDQAERRDDTNGIDEGAQSEDSAASIESTSGVKKGRAKHAVETMAQMVARVKAFMTIGRLRNKEETMKHLRSEFLLASTTVDKKTQIKDQRTETGIKDTFQLFFEEKLFDSFKNKRGYPARLQALDAQAKSMPANVMSPVWRIRGLDPHQDTPVEILHVVLLGFVKYLWRDLIQLQLKNKDDKKKNLITRLNSFDTNGLGISPLAGQTLVQYAGSLTGRDFRAIAQVAPFVVFDLVAPECFEIWKVLSKLVPLIWQPEIVDIDVYMELLTREINHFLACAAQ
ncbi:unnamed protein product [Mycena citricolor]|uniref:Uncharacterized protein n=1 Tax=Mycena citricolor TaxID=2018698 RepID=A0AAD2HUS7_9AGAR|nr:unnamed protein product [Mycena citricolor]